MRKILIIAFMTMGLLSCSGGSDSGAYSDSYDFTSNGCATGKHSFSASSPEALLEKVCAALVDDELNNGCALGLRVQKFNSDCGDTEVQLGL